MIFLKNMIILRRRYGNAEKIKTATNKNGATSSEEIEKSSQEKR